MFDIFRLYFLDTSASYPVSVLRLHVFTYLVFIFCEGGCMV